MELDNMIILKRVYEPATREDGFRIMVERLWPRGLSKQAAHIDLWLKECSPSPELRAWYSHDVTKWMEFQRRYRAELRGNAFVAQLQSLILEKGTITFVFASRDEEHNSARELKDFLEERSQRD
jgi:uncharacterized protein YeaO (DUF488 family)